MVLLHRGLCVTQAQRAVWGELYCSVRPPVSGLGAEHFVHLPAGTHCMGRLSSVISINCQLPLVSELLSFYLLLSPPQSQKNRPYEAVIAL